MGTEALASKALDGAAAGDEALGAVAELAFPLQARTLPPDYALALQQALLQAAPWLATQPLAGVHPLRLASGGAYALLPARARLLLRLPTPCLASARALAGCTLDVQGHALRLGVPQARALLPHGTLYAAAVASPGADEAQFMQGAQDGLRALGLPMAPVCGRHQQRQGPDGAVLHSFSLMLHGLAPAQALCLLEQGLGPHRLLGCGLFVGHKSAAAVGAWP